MRANTPILVSLGNYFDQIIHIVTLDHDKVLHVEALRLGVPDG